MTEQGPGPIDPDSKVFEPIASPWEWSAHQETVADEALCNVCWWSGESFLGGYSSESATCPVCGAIARDRFLLYCLTRTLPPARYRVLETSPRLGNAYREAMSRWFDYRASDYDQRAHRANLRLDLQDLELDSNSLDVVLTPHVLEHVPSTDAALREIHRVLRPGGNVLLQVPIQQGTTLQPFAPEFHGDRTVVHWRFGLDLTDRLRRHGFRASVHCTWSFYLQVRCGAVQWPDPTVPGIDVRSLLRAARIRDLVPIADEDHTRRLGLVPTDMFLTWVGVKD